MAIGSVIILGKTRHVLLLKLHCILQFHSFMFSFPYGINFGWVARRVYLITLLLVNNSYAWGITKCLLAVACRLVLLLLC